MSELLGANTDVLDRGAESLNVDARRVQDIRTLAQRAVAELQASWVGSDLLHLTQLWEQQASPLLAGATTTLDTCAAQLRAQSAAQRRTSSAEGGSPAGLVAPGSAPPLTPAPTLPPKRGSPGDNATWWRSLSPQQQHGVISEHPDWIGNRDGVASSARNLANRAMLIGHRDRIRAERERVAAGLADQFTGEPPIHGAVAVSHIMAKLASLDDSQASLTAISTTLAQPGERQLLLLDLGQERAQAAIANGNIDTADNVAVFVPGLGTNVTDRMQDYDKEMSQLKHRSELESKRVSPDLPPATTATVTWIGYQAPQFGPDLVTPGKSVTTQHLAEGGAAKLAPFLQGIGAARNDDAHLTLLGHSYGSTTAGLALQQSTGVDDAVFFGSPGLGTSHVQNLKLAPGHAYYVEARWDGVGDLGAFGTDPSHMSGIEHASARASTVVDPVTGETMHYTAVTGHAAYLHDGSTSQYNMSVVVAGVPDRRVIGREAGVGDLFSWPVPGTY